MERISRDEEEDGDGVDDVREGYSLRFERSVVQGMSRREEKNFWRGGR
jgi:hypothetical protein